MDIDELVRASAEKGRENSSSDCMGGVKGDSGTSGGRKGMESEDIRLLDGLF